MDEGAGTLLENLPAKFLGIDGGRHCSKHAIAQRPEMRLCQFLFLALLCTISKA